jgi:hypothetical protein
MSSSKCKDKSLMRGPNNEYVSFLVSYASLR